MKRKWVKHMLREGSRSHVVHYGTDGMRCSEPDCEINKPKGGAKKMRE